MASANSQKVAIVTGGSSGIGRATAVVLAKEEGTKVVVAARREKEGEETAQLVKEAGSDSICKDRRDKRITHTLLVDGGIVSR
jgi:NAD(P)-dependent dehydrogenase (short-subunit alcohol dehydrogenase family)